MHLFIYLFVNSAGYFIDMLPTMAKIAGGEGGERYPRLCLLSVKTQFKSTKRYNQIICDLLVVSSNRITPPLLFICETLG